MKKLIETLKNIWKIEDLRQRILITMLFVAIYRFGSFVVLPGINPALLDKLQSQTAGGLMSLLDMFSGGAFSNASIFALGIMPYISASIVMQLLAVAVPYFQKIAEEKNVTKIGIAELVAAGLTNGKELVKVLGNGELKAKIDVEANAFSKTAEEAIKAVGGNATII